MDSLHACGGVVSESGRMVTLFTPGRRYYGLMNDTSIYPLLLDFRLTDLLDKSKFEAGWGEHTSPDNPRILFYTEIVDSINNVTKGVSDET